MDTQFHTPTSSATSSIVPLVTGGRPARRFSVEEYHRMIETGILTENDRVELLDGWILEMSPIGPPHEVCISLLLESLQQIVPAGWLIRVQSPVTLSRSEPQPDVSVVRGRPRDYLGHHPLPTDIALVVEVSDSSLRFDQLQKRPQYAAAGIAEYWIVNLVERRLEVYRNPSNDDYENPEIVGEGGDVALRIDGKVVGTLKIADLLP